jgi:hypothetical protein
MMTRHTIQKKYAVGLFAVFCCVQSACEKGHGLPLVPVSGHVTFNNSQPPMEGNIAFVQIGNSGQPGVPNRPGRATFGTDGQFAATTFKDGDGLLPGKYQVTISCADAEAKPGQPFDEVSFVPSNYRAEQLIVQQDGGPVEVNFDVPLNPKKAKKNRL